MFQQKEPFLPVFPLCHKVRSFQPHELIKVFIKSQGGIGDFRQTNYINNLPPANNNFVSV